MLNEKKPSASLRRSAGEVKRYRVYTRVIPAVMGVILALMALVYVISLLFNRYGSFTVTVRDFNDRNYMLSLCENDRFNTATSMLNSKAAKNITNISRTSLPENLNDVNGEHNGDNYVAYTFYLKNTGTASYSYDYTLNISRATLNIDSAVRVRLYFTPDYYKAETDQINYGGAYTEYAKPKTNGNGLPETEIDGTVMTNFVSSEVITNGRVDNFNPGDMAKITVVIWIEGDDPDCTDDLLGGQFKVDMIMSIVSE